MKSNTKIETYLALIQGIRYQNENGGSYAYVQFLAYSRELIKLLRPFKSLERQSEQIEAIQWLFNECLAASFTHRHKAIFDEKMSEMSRVAECIREGVKEMYMPTQKRLSAHYAKAA